MITEIAEQPLATEKANVKADEIDFAYLIFSDCSAWRCST